jgi:ectoine hydroxylase-related dioxygenase (phytanoyl-CoA dioxygenase family)
MAWWMTKARRLLKSGGARPDQSERRGGMTAEERFLFDLEGYLVIKQVLSASEVAALNAVAERKILAPSERPAYGRLFQVSAWGTPYQSLIDHPRIVPYLVELVGPHFRLDHDFCIFTSKGGRGQELHGAETDENPDHWYKYRDGVMRNGLTVVTFFLTPAKVGDGGFCCVPGSHKSNLAGGLPADVRDFRRSAHYVVQPAIEAGDVVIFTEALIHGTAPWMADHERLVLLYKYSPGHSAWMGEYYDLEQYTGLTEQQRRILAPPSVGGRPPSTRQR